MLRVAGKESPGISPFGPTLSLCGQFLNTDPQLEEELGVRDPCHFWGNLIYALLVTAFCPHFPKLRRFNSLGIPVPKVRVQIPLESTFSVDFGFVS